MRVSRMRKAPNTSTGVPGTEIWSGAPLRAYESRMAVLLEVGLGYKRL